MTSLIIFAADFQEVLPLILPFFHIFGLNGMVLPRIASGAKLITIPKFTPELFISVLMKHKVRILVEYIFYLAGYVSGMFSRVLYFTGDGSLHSPTDTSVLERLYIYKETGLRKHASLYQWCGSVITDGRRKFLSKVSVKP